MRLYSHTTVFLSAFVILFSCERPRPPAPQSSEATPPAKEEDKRPNRRPDPRLAGGGARNGVKFQRGKYLQQPLGNDGLPPARSFGALPEDMKADLAKLREAAGKSPSADEALALISQARDFNSPEIYPLIEALLMHPDEAVRGSAISLLEGVQHTGALPVLARAMEDTSADVRIQAMECAGRITSPEIAPLLQRGYADDDTSVRQLSFQTAMRQDEATRFTLLEQAVMSPRADLAEAGVGVVEGTPSKITVPLMMEALAQTDPLVWEKAHDMLFLTFHEDFQDPAAAKEWWAKNHRNYDEDLVLKPDAAHAATESADQGESASEAPAQTE